MPIPIVAAKLVSVAPKIVSFVSTITGLGSKADKERIAKNAMNMADLKAAGEANRQKFMALSKEEKQAWKDKQKSTTNDKMDNIDEQINDTNQDTEKSFLGLQSVETAKKQQTKIIMIAGAIILALFFFMRKK